jgi:predicted transcriptional regulator
MNRQHGLTDSCKQNFKTDLIVKILNYISKYGQCGGIQITKIMYFCYLEHGKLRKFLASLTEKKLLCYYTTTKRYKITQKGIDFLEENGQI